ncbi:MAG: hypothetical protein JWM41_3076 [Gemmatimonadetes bacterium]|nr:hypothetical protein [Gemmatimonadota bacterium]
MLRTNFTKRALHDARVASVVAKARPAYAAGFRAAVATVTPLLVDRWFGTGGGAWMSLAGLNGALIDRGGPYRTRAITMTVLALASATVALIGAAVSGHFLLAVPVAFAVAFACGMVRVWPDIGAGFGVTVLVTFAISLAIPSGSVAAALMRPVYILIGGLWALLIAIVVWPLRPYRPVRLSVAACYREIVAYLADVVAKSELGQPHDTWEFKEHLVATRMAIEAARSSLAVSRRGRSGETGRGERLLMLHELADQLYAHLIALMDVVDVLPTGAPDAPEQRTFLDTLRAIANTVRAIAEEIESEDDDRRVPVEWSGAALRSSGDPRYEPVAALLDRMADYAVAASATVATLNSGGQSTEDEELISVGELRAPRLRLFSLRAVARADSVVLQHALRIAIVTSTAVLVTGLLHLDHGYWVTLTAVVILQPYSGATTQKALQRVFGTILGGVVAAGLSALFHNFAAVLILIAIFTALCVALLPLNYGAYAVFGAPAFVLLAESSIGDWHLAGIRITNTLIGGALALAGSRLLWPSEEWKRLPEHAAAALRASREFLRLAIRVATSDTELPAGVLRDARRDIALAASNAEESFQRLLGEYSGPAERLEPIMAFLTYTRRFAASTAALALTANAGGRTPPASLAAFAGSADQILDDLAEAVTNGRPPAPFPAVGTVAMPNESVSPAVRTRVNRLARQLRMLHDSIERWN